MQTSVASATTPSLLKKISPSCPNGLPSAVGRHSSPSSEYWRRQSDRGEELMNPVHGAPVNVGLTRLLCRSCSARKQTAGVTRCGEEPPVSHVVDDDRIDSRRRRHAPGLPRPEGPNCSDQGDPTSRTTHKSSHNSLCPIRPDRVTPIAAHELRSVRGLMAARSMGMRIVSV